MAALLGGIPSGSAAPSVPTDDDAVLERLPEAQDAAARTLRQQQRALAGNPGDLGLAVRVARLDIALGRERGDPRYYGRAEAALAPWTAAADMPGEVRLLRAVLRQASHDFAGAEADLSILLRADPRNAEAWLTRAVIAGVEARYDAALADCGQLANLTDSLAPDVCTAAVMGVTGHARASLAALDLALQRGAAEPLPVRAWALTIMAETAARLGDDEAAEAHFRTALGLAPPDAYLLGAYADFLLDRDRPAEVRHLLADKQRIDPLLLRLALAERRLGDPALAAHIAELGSRFAVSRARGERIHQREEARFTAELLGDPAAALVLAEANWQVQREPADARLLIETANAAGRPAAAAPALDWLERNHVEDRRLAALAARCRAAAGRPGDAS